MFLKENLDFKVIQDELIQNGLLFQQEIDDYVCTIPFRQIQVERLIKLIIKKERCQDFVEILRNMPCRILTKVKQDQRAASQNSKCNVLSQWSYFYHHVSYSSLI